MQKKLIIPAVLAMGFAGAALPAPVLAQSQGQQQDQSREARGDGASGGAYERYLRQLHEGLTRGGASPRGTAREYEPRSEQAQGQGSSREEFMRGYRAGREEERRRREAASGQGGDGERGGQRRQSRQDTGQDGGQDGRSGQRGERVFVIPNVYPDSAPFQQFAVVPDHSRTMDHMLIAAQSLREAIQDLAQQPAGDRRNRAIEAMQDALLETQGAMMRIPPGMR